MLGQQVKYLTIASCSWCHETSKIESDLGLAVEGSWMLTIIPRSLNIGILGWYSDQATGMVADLKQWYGN